MDITEIVHEDYETDVESEIDNLEELIESLRNNDLSKETAPYEMAKDAAAGIVSFVRLVRAINGDSTLATDIFLGVEIDNIINPVKAIS